MNRTFMISIVLVLGVISVAGCTSTPSHSKDYTVTIQNMAFNPSTVYIQIGTTINWINKDSITHRIVSDTGVFESGNLSSGQSYNYTFNQAGNYSYHCAIHPSMTGTIVVFSMTTMNNSVSPMTTTQSNPGNSNNNATGTGTGTGGFGY